MSTKEVDGNHEEGLPWKVVGKFKTFEEAAAHRALVKEEDRSLHVKIHQQARNTKPYYAVKSRIDPEIAAMVKEMEERSKKSRKKR